ncbi:hypothetical protein B4134_2789 [Bacillus safensis]|nr:hypothetical protein B4134_2789 [Bacillus safensis]
MEEAFILCSIQPLVNTHHDWQRGLNVMLFCVIASEEITESL